MLELIPFALRAFYLVPFFVAVSRNHDGAIILLALNRLPGWSVVGGLVLLGIPPRKSRQA